MAALGLWSGRPEPFLLALAGLGVVWRVTDPPRGDRSRTTVAGILLLIASILVGFGAHRQVAQLSGGWEEYWAEREAWVGERLNGELESLLRAGEAAVDALAVLDMDAALRRDPAFVASLRERTHVSAVALYDQEGRVLIWDGVHRGKVPEEVQRGLRRYVYGEVPLFGYLYVTAVTARGGVAVAALLLKHDLPPGLDEGLGDFATRFRAEVGEEISIVPNAAQGTGSVWDLQLPDRTLLSVVLQEPDREARVSQVLDRWRDRMGILVLAAFLLLAVGSRPRLASGAVAAAVLLVLAGALPFEALGFAAPLFSVPLHPSGLPDTTLGRGALVLLAVVTGVAVLPRPRLRLHDGAVAMVALAFPAILAWIAAGVPAEELASGELPWVVYQAVAVTVLAVLAGSAMVFARAREVSPWRGLAALLAALALAVVGARFVWTQHQVPVWWPALSVVPLWIAASALGAWSGWQRPVARWVIAITLATGAALPVAWGHRVEARMAVGEARLRGLVADRDPAAEEALARLGQVAIELDQRGTRPVRLLYSAWRESGLDTLGLPSWLTVWSASGVPEDELGVGIRTRPAVADHQLDEGDADPEGVRITRYDRDDARYLLQVPLSRGRLVTVVLAPFPDPGGRWSPVSPLLGGSAVPREEEILTLIPLAPGDPRGGAPLDWVRTPSGWQGELPVSFPGALYQAHYSVVLPGALLAAARGTLLLVLNLGLFLSFWFVGRSLLHDALPAEARWSALALTFRARVTVALFAFFLLANAVFGTLVARTLEGASRRATQVLAQRVVEDAAAFYLEVSGSMSLLAGRVGAELLEYREGELREGSVEELVDLGLYDGWIPFDVRERLDGREGVREFREGRLGRWSYVVAYRRLPDGDLLAAQLPLQAGTTAIRFEDLVELLGFAVVVGGLLSLGLAFLVGRALTRPIQELQVASELVGAGNLALRLPERRQDEFGAVFRAFNRMVRRIRTARRAQARAARRTQAIMEEAAVGMVALDAEGFVTLVNPRAEELLGEGVPVGSPLAPGGDLGPALGGWLDAFLDSDAEEGGVDLPVGERRIRIRARRLERRPASGGVVVAMEDVTDELRTERVLAWGEMARQVAHEVKNPLTPIKLSVQHIQRAWQDRRPDFEAILARNAEAILGEIDRLAGIARSFSRFGAPSGPEAGPLEAVSVQSVVGDILDLYGSPEGPVRFLGDIAPGLPPVSARAGELKEVLVNLLENARAGVGEQGTIRIEARPDGDRGVVLRVVDDGQGIREELLSRVLEPHFSTRSTGTGLGLAIVSRLVASWGGTVSIASRPGEGTVVRLVLRAYEDEKTGQEPEEAPD